MTTGCLTCIIEAVESIYTARSLSNELGSEGVIKLSILFLLPVLRVLRHLISLGVFYANVNADERYVGWIS